MTNEKTEDHFEEHVSRLVGNWPNGISAELVGELKDMFIRLDPHLFRLVVQRVLETCKFPPKLAHFMDARKEVLNRWTQTRDQEEKGCPACSMGFQEVFIETSEGLPYRAVTPCNVCNSSQWVPKPKKDARTISKDRYDELMEIQRNGEEQEVDEGMGVESGEVSRTIGWDGNPYE